MKKKPTEQEARELLEHVEKGLLGKRSRIYSRLDLIRFAEFKAKHPGLHNFQLINLYDKKHPELSSVQKLNNLMKFLEE